MQAPSTKQELQSFLSMVNYLSQFVPSMSGLTTPLRKLQVRDVLFSMDRILGRSISEAEEQQQQSYIPLVF